MPIPSISSVMTECPHTINSHLKVSHAIKVMHQYKIRHLPVQMGGKLVGVLSERDISLATTLLKDQDCDIEEIMSPDPYAVDPQTPIDEVVEEMAKNKYGCAVIQEKSGHVLGIFTYIDGFHFLKKLLKKK